MSLNNLFSWGRSAVLVGLLGQASPSYSLPPQASLVHSPISTIHQQRREKVERLANYIARKVPNPSAHYRCQPPEPLYEACLAQFIIPPQRYAVMLTWEKDKQSYQGLGIYSFQNLLFPKPADIVGIFDFLSGSVDKGEAARFDRELEKILRSYW